MDFTPASVERFLAADRAGELSTKDRKMITKMRAGAALTPEEYAADLADSLSPMNLKELADTIAATKNPRQKAFLVEEQDRLMALLAAPQATATPLQTRSESFMDTITNILSKIWSNK